MISPGLAMPCSRGHIYGVANGGVIHRFFGANVAYDHSSHTDVDSQSKLMQNRTREVDWAPRN